MGLQHLLVLLMGCNTCWPARGRYKGRKAALTNEQADDLRVRLAAGESVTALAKEFGVSRQTVYNYAA